MSSVRERVSFSDTKPVLPLPDLVESQHKSFQWFIDEGLRELFDEINPVQDYTDSKLSLTFKDYYFDAPHTTESEAKENHVSYESALYVQVELLNKVTGEVSEQEIYLGDYPMMTERATFIINGAERAVVSQIARSSGVFFSDETVSNNKPRYGAKIIPGRGAWLEFETGAKNEIYVKVDKRRKMPVTILLRAFGMSTNKQIKEVFADGPEGMDEYIAATLEKDPAKNTSEALIEVYRRLRPGDLATVENAKGLIDSTFFNYKRYDLSKVGRYKMNRRLGLDTPNTAEYRTMQIDDLVAIIKELVRLNMTGEPADEVDSFANRRLRMVGELMQRYFRIGLLRMDRNVKDRMSVQDMENVSAQQLLNARPVVASVREFFASSQLSQFMDQVNPLSELTHKRRLSATGPGGLTRERAGFDVRDMHRTHYGRACMVETPEGQSIGLVLNLTTYSRINDYGFIETPYRVVYTTRPVDEAEGYIARDVVDENGKTIVAAGKKLAAADIKKLKTAGFDKVPIKPYVSTEVVYFDAQDEDGTVIASASNDRDANGYIIDERVTVRRSGHPGEEDAENVTHMDVSPQQTIGVSASLIPFVEKDNVARALMGANQQRQAVPLLRPEAPIVGTGMEGHVARNSGQVVTAEEDGTVRQATGSKVVVDYKNKGERTYDLPNFTRSNAGTALTYQVRVDSGQKVKKGDLLVDGMSIDHGELAVGANLMVGIMPWGGYNFEDAIVISRRLVEDDTLTSINIEEYSLEVRETKLGPEQITHDIPNVSEDALANLDEEGIVRIGAEVHPGDILAGKITPKGEQELSSEERLLRAVFGEKAKDVRDSSRRMPNGKHGKVVAVKIFSREQGHELKAGILQQIHIYVAEMRKISVGDKLGGRHGNKGVIARILPEEDMPFMDDGQPLDILLNPLGVPSRMNIGQVFETHLGLAAKALGYNVASPAFEGVGIDTIKQELKRAGYEEDGKVQLYDGRTGDAFKERTTVGCMYINKLKHMVDDKIHARATGPYTMVTQQPLGGKAQYGGQRFGEMEVWALEAYGAANTLQEMLTIKSDDVIGRSKAYESIIKNDDIHGPHLPESFNVLVKELQSLNLDISLIQDENVIDAEDVLAEEYESDTATTPLVEGAQGPEVDVTESAATDEYEVLADSDAEDAEVDEEAGAGVTATPEEDKDKE